MANGDAAAAAGLSLVAGTDDRRNGFDEINKTRDYIAANMSAIAGKAPAAHTHLSADITDATYSKTANTVPKRNSAGQIAVGNPSLDDDAANKWYVDNKVGSGGSSQANGPTSAAYNRSLTGSSYYQVWMNSALQFMRNTSSRRYKKNIKTLSGPVALALVLRLRAVTYEAKDKTVTGTHVGLIAEEVDEVFPEVVSRDAGGPPEGVNYEFLVAPLIAAVQELAAHVKALEEP